MYRNISTPLPIQYVCARTMPRAKKDYTILKKTTVFCGTTVLFYELRQNSLVGEPSLCFKYLWSYSVLSYSTRYLLLLQHFLRIMVHTHLIFYMCIFAFCSFSGWNRINRLLQLAFKDFFIFLNSTNLPHPRKEEWKCSVATYTIGWSDF